MSSEAQRTNGDASEPHDTGPGPDSLPSRPLRWLKYGGNVAVLVVAVAAIIVMLNWLGYHYYQRFDLTQTRQYSLSEQTQQLLSGLETEIEITTLYAEGTAEPELFRRVEDLLAEYGRRSGRVRVNQIDPTLNQRQFAEYAQQLRERFAGEVEANEQAMATVRAAYEDVRAFAAEQEAVLNELAAVLGSENQELTLVVPQLNRTFMRVGDDLREREEEIEQTLAEELPDYAAAREMATGPLRELVRGYLDAAVERFDAALTDFNTPAEVEEILLGVRDDYEQMADRLREQIRAISEVDSAGYDELRTALLQNNSLVVTMDAEASRDRPDRGVVVLTLEELYPNLILARMSEGEVRPEQGYMGEEAISSAIMRLTVEHDTKVVFVNPLPRSVLGEGHPSLTYRLAAQRLEQMNFQVREWQPHGAIGPQGQPMQPQPRPTAEPGQTMVFIGLPDPRPRQQRQSLSPDGDTAAADRAIADAIAEGRPTLVVLAPQAPTEVGRTGRVYEPLEAWGIQPDPSRVATRHTAADGGRVVGTTRMELGSWPDEHRLSQALGGLRGVAVQAIPLAFEWPEDADGPQVSFYPLAVTPDDAWGATDHFDAHNARPRDDDPRGALPIVAAAERGSDRLVIVGDRAFATDLVAQSGPQNIFGETLFSEFPANQELFMNSIYWLAGMDDLIAPGARTQDVRRIGSVGDTQMQVIGWGVLAGLPLACLLAGVGVWLVRRQ